MDEKIHVVGGVEMQGICGFLARIGVPVHCAMYKGKPAHAQVAYRADAVDPAGCTVWLLECGGPAFDGLTFEMRTVYSVMRSICDQEKLLPACPVNFDRKFARELLFALGADISIIRNRDCWGHLAEKFAAYRPQVEAYFECSTTGNPVYAVYCMARYCGSSREWAERVIASVAFGDLCMTAYYLAHYCGFSWEWAEQVIASVTIGDCAYAIECMVRHCGSSREWAERVRARA